MNLTEKELQELEKAHGNNEAWNIVCGQIKALRNGQYPPDWYIKVIANPKFDTSIKITFEDLSPTE